MAKKELIPPEKWEGLKAAMEDAAGGKKEKKEKQKKKRKKKKKDKKKKKAGKKKNSRIVVTQSSDPQQATNEFSMRNPKLRRECGSGGGVAAPLCEAPFRGPFRYSSTILRTGKL